MGPNSIFTVLQPGLGNSINLFQLFLFVLFHWHKGSCALITALASALGQWKEWKAVNNINCIVLGFFPLCHCIIFIVPVRWLSGYSVRLLT